MQVFAVAFWVMLIVTWVVVALWPAHLASQKGYSFWLYLVFSIICFPLALLIAIMAKDIRVTPEPPKNK